MIAANDNATDLDWQSEVDEDGGVTWFDPGEWPYTLAA